ncbi:MAG: TolC family protein, partial [Gammaproteobacteria bacterium]|nr:TolC family protein [Gammaproteobacteria bacterium]
EYINRSDLLPQVNLTVFRGINRITHIKKPLRFYSKYYDLRLDQVIFDWAKWNTYFRSEPLISSAEKTLYTANQDLVIRVSKAYLNILAAQDNVEFFEKQYESTKELQDQAQARLEVGEITIADLDQVKANLDIINADLIEARTNVNNLREELQEIIDVQVPALAILAEKFNLPDLNPKSIDDWLNLAKRYNLDMQVANANRLVASKDISIAKGDFLPTAQLTAKLRGSDGRLIRDAAIISQRQFVNVFYVSLDVVSPNLNPYGTVAKTDKARALYHRADALYLEAYRNAQAQISKYYRAVASGKERIKALEQAVIAAQVSLDANKANFEIGDRTYVVILERISDLYRAKRDYKAAIYEYLVSWLELEYASGRLDIKDLGIVNKVLSHKDLTKKDKSISRSTAKPIGEIEKDAKPVVLNTSLPTVKPDLDLIDESELKSIRIQKTEEAYQPYSFSQMYSYRP